MHYMENSIIHKRKKEKNEMLENETTKFIALLFRLFVLGSLFIKQRDSL